MSQATVDISRFRTLAIAAVRLVRNPFRPAYQRYYHFLGAVNGFDGDLVRIQVYGEVERCEWWAIALKSREHRPAYPMVPLP